MLGDHYRTTLCIGAIASPFANGYKEKLCSLNSITKNTSSHRVSRSPKSAAEQGHLLPYFFIDDKLIFFAHVPKAAGSTIENYLTERFGQLSLLNRKWHLVRRSFPGCSRVSPQHMCAELVTHYLPRSPDWTFAIVRNPYTRLASEYRMHLRAGRPRKKLAKYGGYEFHAHLMLSAAKIDVAVFDNHVRRQTDIVPSGTEVFQLERGLENVVEAINRRYGEPPTPISVGEKYKHDRETSAVPSEYLSRRIQTFYAEDFSRFGYSIDYPCRKTRLSDRLAAIIASIIAPIVVSLDRRGRL